MPTSLIAPAVGAAVNFGASKLFGGKKGEAQSGLSSFAPAGINAGGLRSSFGPNGISIGADANRMGLVDSIARGFGDQADLLGGLRASVTPGVSDLRAARLGEIENARSSAIGNLRENLQRRRVLGSSFGQDTISRAESEFAGQREQVAAESFLQELDLSTQLIDQEFKARRAQFQTGLDELNLEADLAAKLSGAATTQLGANARALAELNAKEAAGSGKFFGQMFEPVAKAAGNLFKDGGFPGFSGGTFYGGSASSAPSGYGAFTY